MTLSSGPDRWTIDLANAQRMEAIVAFGFSERQARFLLYVLLHRPSSSTPGLRLRLHRPWPEEHDFLKTLVQRRFATPISTGKLHCGRMFHVDYSRPGRPSASPRTASGSPPYKDA